MPNLIEMFYLQKSDLEPRSPHLGFRTQHSASLFFFFAQRGNTANIQLHDIVAKFPFYYYLFIFLLFIF